MAAEVVVIVAVVFLLLVLAIDCQSYFVNKVLR